MIRNICGIALLKPWIHALPNTVRHNKLKGKDTIAEINSDQPRKAMLRVCTSYFRSDFV